MRSVINRTPLVIPLTDKDRHYRDIVAGRVAYMTTRCRKLGGRHVPYVRVIEDYPWASIECGECGWRALGLVEAAANDPDDFKILTLVPDDMIQQDGHPVYVWTEEVTAQTSRSGFGSLGLDVVDYKYHTHDRLPVLDSNNEIVWPV
ncbi:hypothetical protein N9L01_00225 [bacterium]|nr:hypothetical protein [bacterium]